MKAQTILTAVIFATALFTQAATASTNVPAAERNTAVVQQAAPVAPQQTAVDATEQTSESYTELLQRIKEDSLRELAKKVDTEELVSEVLSSTVRSFMDATLNSKPQL